MHKIRTLAWVAATTLAWIQSAVAQQAAPADNSDVVGTWYSVSDITRTTRSPEPTRSINIIQFHADGTLIEFSSTFAGIMSRGGMAPMATGEIGPYIGDWTRMPDGRIRIVMMHFEANAKSEGVLGALKAISKATDTFDPVAGKMYHCIQLIPITNGLYDPDKNDPNSLPRIDSCPQTNGVASERVMHRLK